MDTDNFIVYIKIEDIYPDIIKDVETRFGTSIGLLKDELGGKIIT